MLAAGVKAISTQGGVAVPSRAVTVRSMSTRTHAAVDGAAAGNPGPGGWSWYIDEFRWASGGEGPTTNNRMELTAVIELLESVAGPLHIVCDSRYVVDSATKWMRSWKRKGWRKADGSEIANRDLFVRLDAALTGRDIHWEWCRGHNGHPLNEAADTRARAAAEAVRDGRLVVAGPDR